MTNTSTSISVEDPLRRRYFYKLSNNLVNIPIVLATQAIVPRGLGPVAYGSYSYLTVFFTQVVGFFESGTSLAFYSKVSQRPDEWGLMRFYWGLAFALSLLLLIAVGGVIGGGLNGRLWPGQAVQYVLMASVLGLLTWYSRIINKAVDAHALTVKGERARLLQRIVGFVLLLGIYWLVGLTLASFFLYNYFIVAVLSAGLWWVLIKNGIPLFSGKRLPSGALKGYYKEFYQYSAPLLVYTLVGMTTVVADRWMLQRFAGSIQQGFYGFSNQIASMCFLFASSMSPLLMREFSVAFGQNDTERMKKMFLRYIPLFYFITTYFSTFFFSQAESVTLIFGGKEFSHASSSIAVMSLYPIYQTYGQLSGAVFYATGQTVRYSNIGIATFLLGVPVTYFLLAPTQWFGLELGAVGLSLKMVAMAFIAVNIQLYYNARFLDISFKELLSHQLLSLLLLVCLACTSKIVVNSFFDGPYLTFILGGVLYTIGILILFFAAPSMFLISKGELQILVASLKKHLGR